MTLLHLASDTHEGRHFGDLVPGSMILWYSMQSFNVYSFFQSLVNMALDLISGVNTALDTLSTTPPKTAFLKRLFCHASWLLVTGGNNEYHTVSKVMQPL